MKKNEKLIIFDLFGVVFNKGLESSIDRLVAALDKPEKMVELAYRKWEKPFDIGKIDEDIFWKNINSELGVNINPSVLSNIVISAYQPKYNTIQLARFLKRKHRVIVYSNYRREWFNRLDELHDIEVNFDEVIISSDTKLLKPDPAVFYSLEEEFDTLIENMVLIDDEQTNVEGMKRLGGNAVLFKNVFETEVTLRSIMGSKMPKYDYSYSGILLRTRQGALILQRRDKGARIANSGRISVFGGRNKRRESAIECAIRELQEETGINKNESDFVLLKRYGAPDENGRWVDCSYFVVEVEVNEVDIKEGQGIEVWYPDQALMQEDLTEVPRVLIEFLNKKSP